ncbi:probable lipid-A-disaccharide synthase, mitochondrial isoform X1 [Selaginella moellendorffii]|uniref:probable lipid-A-disaccharide synthase, mitochondrial isoform X1 n=2 Tax=Selaginella moellendorffii TaxID=88036 RepID=UPI000D1CB3E1|nr:probable lipid-A-disaccharide synthase, mitochondrial isoform X1 [Selaginella moellendorffii]|eukprot:XP_024528542.1 probable lipid-A-disaccharide synthase, mitochondrial isoform X1 [Selaginella moellendorffii]
MAPWLLRSCPARRVWRRWLSGDAVSPGRRTIGDPVRVFVVAGEPSGDVIGGRLVAAMRELWPDSLRLSGIGGSCMEREGVKSIFEMDDLAVMGVTELLPHLITLSRRLHQAVDAAVRFDPHIIVTIDSKGFSFRFLRKIKDFCAKSKVPGPFCVHYVCPSFWAWKGGEEKLRNLSGVVDHLLCILPFEEGICKSSGLNASFVGHPVLDDAFDLAGKSADFNVIQSKWMIHGNGQKFRQDHNLPSESPVITVLPGSRAQELHKMLPIYGSALKHLSRSLPGLAAIIPTVPNRTLTGIIDMAVRDWGLPVVVVPGASLEDKYNSFAASDAALVTSGTAVMQLQMCRVPCVVAYRANIFTEWIIKQRTVLKYVSLPNILLDSPAVPEALFSSCKPDRLACLLENILEDPVAAREDQAKAAESVLHMIQPPEALQSPSRTAARIVLAALEP